MENKGYIYAFSAYIGWALLSMYWKQIDHGVDAIQITSHRIFWSVLSLLILLGFSRKLGLLKAQIQKPKTLWIFVVSALLLISNWGIYIYAVVAGHIIETSLGYFINPLVSVLIGVFFFHEKMRRLQWGAVGVAFLGVIYLSFALKALPYIPLSLALTFGFYGFAKKKVKVDSMVALTLETGAMFVPALAFLIFAEFRSMSTAHSFFTTNLTSQLMLLASGLVTIVPLLWFARAVKSIPLSTMGFIQYLTPTSTFLIGLLVYKEHFDSIKLIGYSIVWIGVLMFILDSILNNIKSKQLKVEQKAG